MTRRRAPEFTLAQAVPDPGFTPRRADIEALVELFANADNDGDEGQDLTKHVERALMRGGAAAARALALRASSAPSDRRGRLTALVGRITSSQAPEDEELRAFLLRALHDSDPSTRKAAAIALGKLGGPEVEEALAQAAEREGSSGARRAVIEALGKVGQARAIEALAAISAEEPTLKRARSRSTLMAKRTLERQVPSAFAADKPCPSPMLVAIRCRRGLEDLLKDELDPELIPRVVTDNVAGPRVEVTLAGAPARLLKARTLLSFGFLLPERAISAEGGVAGALIEALSSEEAVRALSYFTVGPLRYRIAWARGGKRRGAVWQVAEEVARRRPELINDPTSSPWQAVVHEGPRSIRVELVPRFEDTRFSYRLGDVPAASHPTIAAALARVAGARPDDVVWDPFVGSGTELCERAIAGPYALLIGSDTDAGALSIARENLRAAGAERFKLYEHDATRPPPFEERPTLVLTNPPMGRRVHRSADLGPLLDRFIENAAAALADGGRLVWVSPFPERTAEVARRAGLSPVLERRVDMGGFDAQIQAFVKPGSRRRIVGRPAKPARQARGPLEIKRSLLLRS